MFLWDWTMEPGRTEISGNKFNSHDLPHFLCVFLQVHLLHFFEFSALESDGHLKRWEDQAYWDSSSKLFTGFRNTLKIPMCAYEGGFYKGSTKVERPTLNACTTGPWAWVLNWIKRGREFILWSCHHSQAEQSSYHVYLNSKPKETLPAIFS